jgi:hypothetical protein
MGADGLLVQRTPQIPIGWFALTADTVPYTIIGAIDWADITVAVDILLPKSTTGNSTSIGWVAARLSQTAEECDGADPDIAARGAKFSPLALNLTMH